MDDKKPVDDYQVITEENAGSTRNGDVAANKDAHISVASHNEIGDETVLRAGSSASAVGGHGDRERDLVSRFRRLGSVLLTEVDVRGCVCGRTIGFGAPGTSAVEDGDLQRMYVLCFLREAGEGTITDSVYDGNYDQLVGYLCGRLEK